MGVNLSRVRAGDKVLLRDGSKIVVDDRAGKMPLMAFMTDLSKWRNDGVWSAYYPNCPFDIVGVVYSGDRATPPTNKE